MKQFLVLALVFLLTFTRVGAAEEKPYLAVFCNPGNFALSWTRWNPDLCYNATSWDRLDDFLEIAKTRANGKHIDIDIECHGDKYLTIAYTDNCSGEQVLSHATMGYVLNHVEKVLGTTNFTLIFESCFGGYVYKTTIRDNKSGRPGEDLYLEDHAAIPPYPVYGGSFNRMNINNAVYLQYKTHIHYLFCDLRKFEAEGGGAKDKNGNSTCMKQLCALWGMLSQLYSP